MVVCEDVEIRARFYRGRDGEEKVVIHMFGSADMRDKHRNRQEGVPWSSEHAICRLSETGQSWSRLVRFLLSQAKVPAMYELSVK